jgi:hypothetical protein
MSASYLSRRTIVIGVIGLAVVAAVQIAASTLLAGGHPLFAAWVSDIGELLVVGAAAVLVFLTAGAYGRGEPGRRQWGLIAAGVTVFWLGEAVYAYYDLALRVVPPYPGLPDLFYVPEYPLMAAGLVLAALAYGALAPSRRPLVMSALLTVVLGVALWVFLLQGLLADSSVSAAEKALSMFYPLGDLVLLVAPALFIALVLGSFGGARLAMPWRIMAAGIALLGVTDSLYSYMTQIETYVSGSWIDWGWPLGFLLIGIAALVARDAYGV